MELILVARSIGKPSCTAPLSGDSHVGLVFNLGQGQTNDHWIAQSGPQEGYLVGAVRHCPSYGWYQEFSTARGAIWYGRAASSSNRYLVENRYSTSHQRTVDVYRQRIEPMPIVL